MSFTKENTGTARTRLRGTQRIKSELGGSINNIQGKSFDRLTAIHPTTDRDPKGSVIWACLCECKNVVYVSEDVLVHSGTKSCGCLKKEQSEKFHDQLHFVDGTCVEWIENRKHRSDNTSGFRGVYKIRDDRWRVGIGFKGKKYHIGYYRTFEEAKEARLNAEDLIYLPFLQQYYASIGSEKYVEPDLLEKMSPAFQEQFLRDFSEALFKVQPPVLDFKRLLEDFSGIRRSIVSV